MSKEFRRMQQLAGLLTEVKIVGNHGILPKSLEKSLQKLYEKSYFMFESGSPDDDEPITDGAYANILYEDGEISEEEFDTFKKYTGKQFVSNIFFHESDIPNPNKPKNAFNTLIKIYTYLDDYLIEAMIPNIDMDGVQTGWFNARGEYISTVENVNEVKIVPNGKPHYALIYTHETPFYTTAFSLESMLNKLNIIRKELTGEQQTRYDIEDFAYAFTPARLEKKLGTYIADNWAVATDDKHEFEQYSNWYNPPPKKYTFK